MTANNTSAATVGTGEVDRILIITDPRLLIRPKRNSGYPPQANHDTGRVSAILDLGNAQYGIVEGHIIFAGTPDEAHTLLDRVFHYYVDGCVMQLDCSARVLYKAGNVTLRIEEYGVTGGAYELCYNVHCGVVDVQEYAQEIVTQTCAPTVVVSPSDDDLGYRVSLVDMPVG